MPAIINLSASLDRGVGWDAQLAAGVGVWRDDDRDRALYARARVGAVLVWEPWFLPVGVTGQFGGIGGPAAGFEAELIHLWTGLWAQAGAQPIAADGPVLAMAVGWSVLGIEWQHDLDRGDDRVAVMLRAPLGMIGYALARRSTAPSAR